MKNNDNRQFVRADVALNLRSVQLPKYSAEVVDFSQGGARILLKTNRVPCDLWRPLTTQCRIPQPDSCLESL